MKLTLALIFIASTASATPWTIDRGDGVYEPNPSCSSQQCHDTGVPDKPPVSPNPAEKSDAQPRATSQAWTGGCGWLVNTKKLITHTAFGHTDAEAKRQCKARVQRLQSTGKPVPVYSGNATVFGGFEKLGERQ